MILHQLRGQVSTKHSTFRMQEITGCCISPYSFVPINIYSDCNRYLLCYKQTNKKFSSHIYFFCNIEEKPVLDGLGQPGLTRLRLTCLGLETLVIKKMNLEIFWSNCSCFLVLMHWKETTYKVRQAICNAIGEIFCWLHISTSVSYLHCKKTMGVYHRSRGQIHFKI